MHLFHTITKEFVTHSQALIGYSPLFTNKNIPVISFPSRIIARLFLNDLTIVITETFFSVALLQ